MGRIGLVGRRTPEVTGKIVDRITFPHCNVHECHICLKTEVIFVSENHLNQMTTSVPIRLKIDMESDRRKSDNGFQWQEESRKHWIVAMFCGTLLLYATRSAVPLCLAAMSSDMNWDKEIDVSL